MERPLREVLLAVAAMVIASVVGATIGILTADRGLSIMTGLVLLLVLLLALVYLVFSREKKSVGIRKIFQRFDDAPSTPELLRKAKTHFSFLGISARSFFEFDELEDILKKKAREGCKFRFLLLDPTSEFLILKAKDENDDPVAWRNDISAGIKRLESVKERLGSDNLDVRTYSAFPIWRGIFIDNALAYVSYYPHGHRGKRSPIISLSKEDISLYDPFFDYFEELWKGR